MQSMYYNDGIWIRFRKDGKLFDANIPVPTIQKEIDKLMVVNQKPCIKFKNGPVIQLEYDYEITNTLISEQDIKRMKGCKPPDDYRTEEQKSKYCLVFSNKVFHTFDTLEEAEKMHSESHLDFRVLYPDSSS